MRLGRFAEALKLARAIDAETVPANVAKPNQLSYLDSERFNKALTFAVIAEEQVKTGDQAGARQSAEEVVRIVETIHDYSIQGIPTGPRRWRAW